MEAQDNGKHITLYGGPLDGLLSWIDIAWYDSHKGAQPWEVRFPLLDDITAHKIEEDQDISPELNLSYAIYVLVEENETLRLIYKETVGG